MYPKIIKYQNVWKGDINSVNEFNKVVGYTKTMTKFIALLYTISNFLENKMDNETLSQ